MNENLFQTEYNITRKSKLRKFYDEKKVLIFSVIAIFLIITFSIFFYLDKKEEKKLAISDSYIEAKIYLEKGNVIEATNILRKIIFADDSTYSTLSLFLILNENLLDDNAEILDLFNHVINNNNFDEEIKNLVIFKKALYQSSFVGEKELIESARPIINSDNVWKPHALLLIGDYFFSRKEYLKAKEFYLEIMLLKNLHKDVYDHAKSHLAQISNN